MARGTLTQKSCKHHTLSWKLGYDDIKNILEGQSLKAPYISMEDEIDVLLSVEVNDPEIKKLMDEFKNKAEIQEEKE